MARKKPSATMQDSSDSLFFWVIGIVIATGLAANIYSKVTESSPSMTTFLDLLTTKKTFYCDFDGKALTGVPQGINPNCIDYHGYRIVDGDTTYIYEIVGRSSDGTVLLQQAAQMKTKSLTRLFNLKTQRSSTSAPAYPWP